MLWYQINAGKVAHETIDGETIIINFDSGAYYSTDLLGMEIWEQLKSGVTLPELTETVARSYSGNRAEMEAALQNFVAEMVGEGLVVTVETSTGDVPADSQPAIALTPFLPPILHKYTDMQDLLLLDPIHDVDTQGWPLPKQN